VVPGVDGRGPEESFLLGSGESLGAKVGGHGMIGHPSAPEIKGDLGVVI
jgi:hypothetical protein